MTRKMSKGQYDEIQNMIETLKKTHFLDPKKEKEISEPLFELSQQYDYYYGEAIACVYLANYYSYYQETEHYTFYIKKARSMAQRKELFEVMVDVYKLEGLHAMSSCDEISAINAFVDGIQMAHRLHDDRACAIFYNNIAEIFMNNASYDEAENYYLKSFELWKNMEVSHCEVYLKSILLNLVNLAYETKDIEKALDYMIKCRQVICEDQLFELMEQTNWVRCLFLQKNEEDAFREIEALVNKLKKVGSDPELAVVYLFLMEIFINTKQLTHGKWCIECLKKMANSLEWFENLQVQNLRISFNTLFDLEDDGAYARFYEISQEVEKMNKKVTGDSFKNFVRLYDAHSAQKQTRQKQQALEEMVNRDELTGLYNRRYYRRLISKYLENHDVRTLGYAMVDVDYFKQYNDLYGHAKGDTVLKEVAESLEKSLPENAVVARFGGDEFSCLFIDKKREEIVDFIKKVQDRIEASAIEHRGNPVERRLTLTLGFVNLENAPGLDEERLTALADEALYSAKKRGRNNFAMHESSL